MFTSRQRSHTWVWWLAYPALGLPLTAATIVLPAVADTSIFSAKPDNDLGGTSLVSGTNQQYSQGRAMFRFDLSALPAGAVVTGAEVSFSCWAGELDAMPARSGGTRPPTSIGWQ